jgi:hypothetical protein
MARGSSSSKVRFVQDSSSPFVPSLLTTLLPKSSRNCTKAAGTKSRASGKKSASQPNVPTPSTSASDTMKPKTLSARQIANMAFPGEEEDLKPIRRPLPSALPYPSDSEVSRPIVQTGNICTCKNIRRFAKISGERISLSSSLSSFYLLLSVRKKLQTLSQGEVYFLFRPSLFISANLVSFSLNFLLLPKRKVQEDQHIVPRQAVQSDTANRTFIEKQIALC